MNRIARVVALMDDIEKSDLAPAICKLKQATSAEVVVARDIDTTRPSILVGRLCACLSAAQFGPT